MDTIRRVWQVTKSRPTLEGAGVKLKRAFGFSEAPNLDPFLLLDHFGSENPEDYLAGFPWHPHRGMETVTYMIRGEVEHGDSLGNRGTIRSGDVQWMTAGSGIIHQEMPRKMAGLMTGFQLWVNLPAAHKMMAPRYRDILAGQIPEISSGDGVRLKIVSGEIRGVRGPVTDLVVETEYLDVALDPVAEWRHPVASGKTACAYLFEGSGFFDPDRDREVPPGHLVVLGDGERVHVSAGTRGARFILVSGKPLHEPVAWRGPIVMNTEAELEQAFREYREGTFIKSKQVRRDP
ncbi:MAG: pirin family protein [Deltaproteobacteria bacterium]|nr:pirin family protein [Deltaproteobacteria bacterium]